MAWLLKCFHIRGPIHERAALLIPILWSCAIGFFSILPARLVNGHELRGSVHAFTHVLAFCITMAVFSICAKTLKRTIVYALWALSLSVISEWLETVVFHSRFEWADVSLDFAGVALGMVFVAIRVVQHRGQLITRAEILYREDGPQ